MGVNTNSRPNTAYKEIRCRRNRASSDPKELVYDFSIHVYDCSWYVYGMRLGHQRIGTIVTTILKKKGALQAGELAQTAKISRQAAHRHLRKLVQEGVLVRAGMGRGTCYQRKEARLRVRREGLEEDRLWKEVRPRVSQTIPENADRILYYAFTELVNNAIDHSQGSWVEVAFPSSSSSIVLEVFDDGVGVFEHIRGRMGLPDLLSALQEVSKGKLTTAPDRHTGEGIFFVSKIADFFELESNGLCWKVDNVRIDAAVAEASPRRGTRARFEVDPRKTHTLSQLFEEYTKDYEFSKTRIVVKLFTIGVRFVSRSEAKRLLQGLEKFREVVLDFSGVKEVGQGFADEVFRVWVAAHPEIRLVPENISSTVAFMVRRARGKRA